MISLRTCRDEKDGGIHVGSGEPGYALIADGNVRRECKVVWEIGELIYIRFVGR